MRWADALKASKTGKATRIAKDDNGAGKPEPNIILNDPKFPKAPKLFRQFGDDDYGWRRIPLKEADKYDDWTPA